LSTLDRTVSPLTSLSQTVSVTKSNIDQALSEVQRVVQSIDEQDEVCGVLTSKPDMIASEFEVYTKCLERAGALKTQFMTSMSYFPEAYARAEQIGKAMEAGVAVCEGYVDLNIKKMLASEKGVKRYRQVIRVVEQSGGDAVKMVKRYVEVRRGKRGEA
jgi:hypothetical protein